MSDETNERRCKSCGKLLIDEKIPFCRRCVLEGRNKVGLFGGIVSALITVVGAPALINNNADDRNDTNGEDDYYSLTIYIKRLPSRDDRLGLSGS